MKKQIAIVLAVLIGIISFQNCAETESVLPPSSGIKYIGKISKIDSVSHGDLHAVDLKVQVDLNTNEYSILQRGNVIRQGEVPSEIREQMDDILVNPEICQLVPPPQAVCTLQYRPPTTLVESNNIETVIDWNKCQSHKVLCNGRTSELRSLLIELQNL